MHFKPLLPILGLSAVASALPAKRETPTELVDELLEEVAPFVPIDISKLSFSFSLPASTVSPTTVVASTPVTSTPTPTGRAKRDTIDEVVHEALEEVGAFVPFDLSKSQTSTGPSTTLHTSKPTPTPTGKKRESPSELVDELIEEVAPFVPIDISKLSLSFPSSLATATPRPTTSKAI